MTDLRRQHYEAISSRHRLSWPLRRPSWQSGGRGQICKSRAGSASRQSGRTLTARVAIVARAIAITILLAISGASIAPAFAGRLSDAVLGLAAPEQPVRSNEFEPSLRLNPSSAPTPAVLPPPVQHPDVVNRARDCLSIAWRSPAADGHGEPICSRPRRLGGVQSAIAHRAPRADEKHGRAAEMGQRGAVRGEALAERAGGEMDVAQQLARLKHIGVVAGDEVDRRPLRAGAHRGAGGCSGLRVRWRASPSGLPAATCRYCRRP